jgi:hypothetical protein
MSGLYEIASLGWTQTSTRGGENPQLADSKYLAPIRSVVADGWTNLDGMAYEMPAAWLGCQETDRHETLDEGK